MTDRGSARRSSDGADVAGVGTSAGGPAAAVDAAWATAFQTLANYVAHDFRNALNGVAVNLEVVRGRSARGAEASAIAPFAATATAQFEGAAAAAEALLEFARPEPGLADVEAILARLSRLISVRGKGRLRVEPGGDGIARTPAPAGLVRAVVARSVLTALSADDEVACEITVADGIFLRVTGASHAPPLPDSELVALAAGYDVRFVSRGTTLELCFPAVA